MPGKLQFRQDESLKCSFQGITHISRGQVKYTLRKHAHAIFHGCKNDKFQMKNCDIFLIFAQNIDCGYTLEPPQ